MKTAELSPSLMCMDLDKFTEQITFLNKHIVDNEIIFDLRNIMKNNKYYTKALEGYTKAALLLENFLDK